MSKSNLINSLFKIDAAEGLVRYTNSVKPYHSKLLDVLIEYIYKEDIKVKVTEKWNTDIQQFYTSGEIVWNETEQKFESSGSSCYFQVNNNSCSSREMSPGVWEHTWVVDGIQSDKFLPGNRLYVSFANGTAKVFIVQGATPSITSNTTSVITVPTNGNYLYTAKSIELTVTPDYRIMGAVINPSSDWAWVIEGDQRDQFQVGETIMVAVKHDDLTVYTVRAAPTVVVDPTSPISTVTHIPVVEQPMKYLTNSTTGFHRVSTGTLRYIPLVFNQIIEPTTTVRGAVWINPVTNVSKRWDGQWIHNYTPTSYSWFLGTIPSPLIIERAIAQIPAPSYNTQISISMPIFSATGVDTPLEINGMKYTVSAVVDPSTVVITGKYVINIGDLVTATPILSKNMTHNEIVSVQQPHTFVIGDYIMYSNGVWSKSFDITPHFVVDVPDSNRFLFQTTDYIKSTAGIVIKSWDAEQYQYGTPVTFNVTATGYNKVGVNPDHGISNSFLTKIDHRFQSHSFTMASAKSNELMFSTPYTIIGVDPISNKWVVSGVADVIEGETIYITSSTIDGSKQGLGKYTVKSVSPGTLPDTTDIVVVKQISRLASAGGILTVPADTSTLPNWVEGTRVNVSSTDTLPDPLMVNTPYYFIPVIKPFAGLDEEGNTGETPPVFALSKVRKPRDWNDYIDITTFGTGVLSITQTESYVPGSKIIVRDSIGSTNNGSYTILQSVIVSPTRERIFVQEPVRTTTPVNQPHDGVIVYDIDSHMYSSLTQKTCKAREMSGLYAATKIADTISFTFEVAEFDFITAKLTENEPRNEFFRELGFDMPYYDGAGFDGTIVEVNEISPMWGSSAYSHSMMEIGFDTQFFDVGAIDETISTVSTYYGRTVPPPPLHTVWDADYRRRERSHWDDNTSPWDTNL